MIFGYVPVETFNKSHGDKWIKYINWSKLHKLNEVVSLDSSLCPMTIDKLEEHDYSYVSYSWSYCKIFSNLDWVLKKTQKIKNMQILAVLRNPTDDSCISINNHDFNFCGFDLIDEGSGISALLNCGGFDKAFTADDLSTCGLIYDYKKAIKVQKSLIENYPDEEHANCILWAIWKMIEQSKITEKTH